MDKKSLWIGLAVSACGIALLSRARVEVLGHMRRADSSTPAASDESPQAVSDGGARQTPAQAPQLPTRASPSPLIVLVGSGLVAVAIAWAAVRKYVTSPSA